MSTVNLPNIDQIKVELEEVKNKIEKLQKDYEEKKLKEATIAETISIESKPEETDQTTPTGTDQITPTETDQTISIETEINQTTFIESHQTAFKPEETIPIQPISIESKPENTINVTLLTIRQLNECENKRIYLNNVSFPLDLFEFDISSKEKLVIKVEEHTRFPKEFLETLPLDTLQSMAKYSTNYSYPFDSSKIITYLKTLTNKITKQNVMTIKACVQTDNSSIRLPSHTYNNDAFQNTLQLIRNSTYQTKMRITLK